MVDLTALPQKIRDAANELSKKIDFESVNIKGNNGYVLVGTNRIINRKVVVKFYYWGDGAHAEPRFLSELASTHVLKVDDAAAIDYEDAYFITPFCDGGDLDDIIQKKNFGVRGGVDAILDIASGASFIHGKGFIHRDIKPSNIFYDNVRLLIGDFGSVAAIGVDGYANTGSRHSLLYRTPEEILSGRAYVHSDIYQIGIVFFQLLGGRLPYAEQDWLKPSELEKYLNLSHPDNQFYATQIIEEKIIKGRLLDFGTLPSWCPPSLKSVIQKCCKVDLDKRFESVSALITKLNNIRTTLPDWRFDSNLTLHKKNAKFRIIESNNLFYIEKMVKTGNTWRRVHSVKPASLDIVVEEAQRL